MQEKTSNLFLNPISIWNRLTTQPSVSFSDIFRRRNGNIQWFGITAFTLSPPPELVSKLQWPGHPNLETSTFVRLFEDTTVHRNHWIQYQAALGFLWSSFIGVSQIKPNTTHWTFKAFDGLQLRRFQSSLDIGGGAGQDVDYLPAVTLHFWPSGHRVWQRLPWLRLKLLVNLLFRPPLSPEAGCHFPPRTESCRGLNCGAEDEVASSCSLSLPWGRTSAPLDSTVWLCERGTCTSVVNPNSLEEKRGASPSVCFLGCPNFL